MWRSKKFIIFSVLAAVLLFGSIGGIALAADNGGDNQPKARCGALLDRVCEIYNANPDRPSDIDCNTLKAAFAEVRDEIRPEALQNRREMGPVDPQDRLQNLISEGKITQEQVDALQEWRDARPDVPEGFGFKGHSRFRGMDVTCAPTE